MCEFIRRPDFLILDGLFKLADAVLHVRVNSFLLIMVDLVKDHLPCQSILLFIRKSLILLGKLNILYLLRKIRKIISVCDGCELHRIVLSVHELYGFIHGGAERSVSFGFS